MKKLFSLIFILCISVAGNGQQLHMNWIDQVGGAGWDIVNDIAITEEEGVVVAGSFNDTICIQGKCFYSKGSRDIFLAKYSKNGKVENAVSFGSIGYDYARKIEALNKTDLALTIKFNGLMDIQENKIDGKGQANFLLARFDPKLSLLNKSLLSCTGNMDITDIKTDYKQGLYISGWFTDTLRADKFELISENAEDLFIGKLSENGTLSWIKSYGGKGTDKLMCLLPDSCFGTYICGITNSSNFGDISGVQKDEDFTNHLFWAQIDPEGKLNNVNYLLSGIDIEPVEIVKTEDKLWILSNFNYFVNTESDRIKSKGKNDFLVINQHFNTGKNQYLQFGGTGNDQAKSISKSANHIVLTGFFSDTLKIGDFEIISDQKGSDIFIATLNEEGIPKNVFAMKGEFGDFPCALKATSNSIFVAGEFAGNLKLEGNELITKGKEDIFIANFEKCNPKPNLNIVINPFIVGSNFKGWDLEATSGFSKYYWERNTSSSRFAFFDTPGTYQVQVEDCLDCPYKKQFTLAKTEKSNEKGDMLSVISFKLYPSVTSDLVYWQASSEWEKSMAMVNIYDSAGRLVSSFQTQIVPAGTYRISFSDKPEGTYLVEIKSALFQESARVIVKR